MAEGAITLRTNDAYYGRDSVLPTAVYLTAADGNSALSALNSGQAEVAVLPGSLAASVSAKDTSSVFADTAVYAILFNRSGDYFSNANLRTALLYGLNRASFKDSGTPSAVSLIPGSVTLGGKAYSSFLSASPFPAYDAAAAKQRYRTALAELGLFKVPSLALLVPDGSNAADILAPVLQSWQRDLSFYINLQSKPLSDITAAIQSKEYDAALIALTAGYDSPLSVLVQFTSSSPANIYGYQNAAYDQLIASIPSLSSEQAQAAAFLQAEQMLADAGLLVPVHCEQTALVCASGVSGLLYPQGLDWVSFKTAVLK